MRPNFARHGQSEARVLSLPAVAGAGGMLEFGGE